MFSVLPGLILIFGFVSMGLVNYHDQELATQKAPATYAQSAVDHLYFPQQKVAFTNCLKEHESSHPLNPLTRGAVDNCVQSVQQTGEK